MRSASIYLLRQYFEHINDKPADLDLQLLDEHYKKVKAVNEGFMARINSLVEKDADKNAIVTLNALAQILVMEVEEDMNSLKPLFS